MGTSNTSLYDDATAAAEAALLALRVSGKNRILISSGVHPEYIQTVKTYLENSKVKIEIIILSDNGRLDKKRVESLIDDNTAAVVIQSPNYFGIVEDMDALSAVIKSKNSLFVTIVNPLSLGIFKSPREYNADIAVGEGQVLGLQ
jgi:glycine dehydrogenase subunit 1